MIVDSPVQRAGGVIDRDLDVASVDEDGEDTLVADRRRPDTWCVEPGEVFGVGSSGARDCCSEHVGLSPVKGLRGFKGSLQHPG